RPNRHHVARRTGGRNDLATHRRGHFNSGLIRHHFNDDIVLGYDIASLNAPADDFRFYRTLSEVREFEYVTTHAASITPLSASAIRAGPGKYSHSKAWGYGVSQPVTL